MKVLSAILLFALIPVWSLAQSGPEAAETIYYNGRIVTVSDARPIAEAVAIRGNHFLAVGSNQEVLRTADARTKKIDLRGRTVLPGLIDSHTHPIMAAPSYLDAHRRSR